MWEEFKQFAVKGNVLDLAVGVIIGAAFGKIISSLVNDIMTPLIGLILGGIDLTKLHLKMGKADVTYGVFFQNVLDFLIVSLALFFFVKILNNLRKKEPEEPVEEPALHTREEVLLEEIRDLLKKGALCSEEKD